MITDRCQVRSRHLGNLIHPYVVYIPTYLIEKALRSKTYSEPWSSTCTSQR